MDCTFEMGFCAYTQATNDQFDWTRLQGGTSSEATGPSFDHTSGSGWYVYVEATGRSPGDKAQLTGPSQNALQQGTSKCLVFWYHMYGANVNRFNVYIRYFGSQSTQEALLYTKYGTQGNQWLKAEKSIDSRDNWGVSIFHSFISYFK